MRISDGAPVSAAGRLRTFFTAVKKPIAKMRTAAIRMIVTMARLLSRETAATNGWLQMAPTPQQKFIRLTDDDLMISGVVSIVRRLMLGIVTPRPEPYTKIATQQTVKLGAFIPGNPIAIRRSPNTTVSTNPTRWATLIAKSVPSIEPENCA